MSDMSTDERVIIIHGQPVPKGRPRVTVRGGRARGYTPKRTSDAEARIRLAAADAVALGEMRGPLRVDAVFILKRPGRLKSRRHPDGLTWCDRRPDVDNLRKLLLDGLADLWGDDAQVVCGESVKVYAERGCAPRTVVRVRGASDVPGWARDLADLSLTDGGEA